MVSTALTERPSTASLTHCITVLPVLTRLLLLLLSSSVSGTLLGQSSIGSGSYDWITLKYDKDNGFLTSNANNPTLRFLYTTGIDEGHSCVSDTAGAVYAAGVSNGDLFASPCGRDTVVVKYDTNMNQVWGVQYDMSQICYDDWAMTIVLYGDTLYVAGNAQRNNGARWLPYIMALSTADGSWLWAAPVSYGFVSNIQLDMRDLAVDTNGNLVMVGAFQYENIPGSFTLNGSAIAPVAGTSGNANAYAAGFDSLGNLRWQISDAAGSQGSRLQTVTMDVTGAAYVGGFTSGSVWGASYQPSSEGDPLPLMQKLDTDGNVLWTVLYPEYDWSLMVQVVTDNIGGIYWLLGNVNYNCYGDWSDTVTYLDSDYSCSNSEQYIYIFKTDVNGAVQFQFHIANGIAQSFSIDNTGLLTFAGDIAAGLTLNGASAQVGGYSGFIDQQLIAYNCSCSNLATLVKEMQTLLNITTG